MAMLLLQSLQVQALRARSGSRGLLQATGQRLVQHRVTTMRPIAGCSLHTFLQSAGWLLSRRDGICHTTPPPQDTTRKNYPSPSRRLSGSRAETSGPSSRRNCAFQSLPRSSMNRPATRRGRIKVATAQMP